MDVCGGGRLLEGAGRRARRPQERKGLRAKTGERANRRIILSFAEVWLDHDA